MPSIEVSNVIWYLKTGESDNELVVDCVNQLLDSDNLWRCEDVNSLRFVAAILSVGDGAMAIRMTRVLCGPEDQFDGLGAVYDWLMGQLNDWKARSDIPRAGWRKALNKLGVLFNCNLSGPELAVQWRKNPMGPQFVIITELVSDSLGVISEYTEMYNRKLNRTHEFSEIQ